MSTESRPLEESPDTVVDSVAKRQRVAEADAVTTGRLIEHKERIVVPDVEGAVPVETTVETTTRTTYKHESPPNQAPAQPQSAPEAKPPSMYGRSEVELRNTAHLIEALFPQLDDTQLLHAFWDALWLGDQLERTDAAIELANKFNVMLEWDGGIYHTEERIPGDIRKLLRMLAADANSLILRVRANGAPSLDDAIAQAVTNQCDRGRILTLHLTDHESRNVGLSLRAISRTLAPKLVSYGGDAQVVYADRLSTVAARSDADAVRSSRRANDLVHKTFMQTKADYADAIAQLYEVMGSEEAARAILETDGVVTRLPAVVNGLKRMKGEFQLYGSDLKTLFCPSMAARLENETFWTSLYRLRDEFSLSSIDLKTMMGDSMAVRLEKGEFWSALYRLRDEFTLSGTDLKTMLSDSMAARLENETFWTALYRLRDEFSLSSIDLKTMMGDSMAVRLEKESFWTALYRLRDEFKLSGTDMKTMLSGSMVVRLEKEEFWTSLYRLRDEFKLPGTDLKTMLNDSIAARLEKGEFWTALYRLRDEFKLSGTDLKTMLSGSIAARLETDAFWTSLYRLRDEFKLSGTDMKTMLSGSMAARLENETFWTALYRLRDEFKLSSTDLKTMLNDSMAARLENETFWTALYRLRDEFKLSSTDLKKILNDSMAARLEKEEFWTSLYRLRDEFSLSGTDLKTMLCDSMAVRLEKEELWDTLNWLKSKGFDKGKICTAQGSFWAASDKSSFRPTIDLLLDEYGFSPTDLPTRNAFWSSISKDGAFDALRDKLAQCRTTGHVNSVIKNMNGPGSIGRGATRCKFVRPKLTHERVEPARATKQSTLGSFFK
jgi:hypothetical protein